jgi:hypothetical protein
MPEIKFERKHFVKNLFNHKNFLNQFNEIQFESFQSFLDSIGNDFLSVGSSYNNYIIINNIDSERQLLDFNSLLKDSKIDQEICIHLKKDFILKNSHLLNDLEFFSISSDIFDDNESLEEFLLDKNLQNRLETTKFELITPINIKNWKYIFDLVIELYMKNVTRFFDLKFDYISLDEMTLKDSREFEFRYKEMNNWTRSNQKNSDYLTINKSSDMYMYKPIYVSGDLKLSINKQSYYDNEFVFDLLKNKDNNGENVEQKDLNKIRQYLDLKIINSYFPIMNSRLINHYHNYILEGSIDELPLISFIVLGE